MMSIDVSDVQRICGCISHEDYHRDHLNGAYCPTLDDDDEEEQATHDCQRRPHDAQGEGNVPREEEHAQKGYCKEDDKGFYGARDKPFGGRCETPDVGTVKGVSGVPRGRVVVGNDVAVPDIHQIQHFRSVRCPHEVDSEVQGASLDDAVSSPNEAAGALIVDAANGTEEGHRSLVEDFLLYREAQTCALDVGRKAGDPTRC
mmetsp:Transcript_63512/g.133866  ORF Transcript_63512/g.133866 Transcript_63512/m.133866 type:complete len:202 (+) Transcript_63512:424-1029(+)